MESEGCTSQARQEPSPTPKLRPFHAAYTEIPGACNTLPSALRKHANGRKREGTIDHGQATHTHFTVRAKRLWTTNGAGAEASQKYERSKAQITGKPGRQLPPAEIQMMKRRRRAVGPWPPCSPTNQILYNVSVRSSPTASGSRQSGGSGLGSRVDGCVLD